MFLSTALPGYLRSMTTARHPRPNGNYSEDVFNPTRAVWHFEVDDTNTHENRPIQTKTRKEMVWNKIKRLCRPLECHTAYESGTELKFWFEMSWHLKAIILILRTRPWSHCRYRDQEGWESGVYDPGSKVGLPSRDHEILAPGVPCPVWAHQWNLF